MSAKMSVSQAGRRGFESHRPLQTAKAPAANTDGAFCFSGEIPLF